MSRLLNAKGNSFIMYYYNGLFLIDLIAHVMVGFCLNMYTCNYKNIRKYICICLNYFFLCFVNLIADINEKSLPRWVSTFDGPPGSGFNESIFILRTVPGNTILQ